MHKNRSNVKNIKSALFGIAVGDALGVPVEFKSREELIRNPVKRMLGFGTYDVPEGTWSDDSSLSFCLAEALTQEYQLSSIINKFVKHKGLLNNHCDFNAKNHKLKF
jgi:ADP-ribosylglycohydrolase